jgi:hypothetical protein
MDYIFILNQSIRFRRRHLKIQKMNILTLRLMTNQTWGSVSTGSNKLCDSKKFIKLLEVFVRRFE